MLDLMVYSVFFIVFASIASRFLVYGKHKKEILLVYDGLLLLIAVFTVVGSVYIAKNNPTGEQNGLCYMLNLIVFFIIYNKHVKII